MMVATTPSGAATPQSPRREPVSAVSTEGKDPVELELNAHLMKEAAQYVCTGHLMYKPGMRPYGARPRSSSPRAAPGTPHVPKYLKGRVSDSPRLQQLVDEIKRGEMQEPEHETMRAIEPRGRESSSSPTRKLDVGEDVPTPNSNRATSLPALQAVLNAYERTVADDGVSSPSRYHGLAIIASSVGTPRGTHNNDVDNAGEVLYGRVGASSEAADRTRQRIAERVEAQEDQLRARKSRMEELLAEQSAASASENKKSEYEKFLENYNQNKLSIEAQRAADARKMEATEKLIKEEEEAVKIRPMTPRANRPVLTSERNEEMKTRMREMAEEKEQLLDEEEEWRDSHDAVLRVRAKFELEKSGGAPLAIGDKPTTE